MPKATDWFFLSYMMLLGVLFVNLLASIIFNMYDMAQQQITTHTGQLQITLAQGLGELSDRDSRHIIKFVGKIEVRLSQKILSRLAKAQSDDAQSDKAYARLISAAGIIQKLNRRF